MQDLTVQVASKLNIPKPCPGEPVWNPIMLRFDRFEQALEEAYQLGLQAGQVNFTQQGDEHAWDPQN